MNLGERLRGDRSFDHAQSALAVPDVAADGLLQLQPSGQLLGHHHEGRDLSSARDLERGAVDGLHPEGDVLSVSSERRQPRRIDDPGGDQLAAAKKHVTLVERGWLVRALRIFPQDGKPFSVFRYPA